MFGKHWTQAKGTVVDRRTVGTTSDGQISSSEFIVDVRTSTGETFRAKVKTPRIATNFMAPTVGMVVGVEYDPGSHKVRFDKSDPALSTKALRMPRRSDFDEALNQPAGTPVPGAQALDPRAQAFIQAQLQAKTFRQAQQQPHEQDGRGE
jgi:hypothetical protein